MTPGTPECTFVQGRSGTITESHAPLAQQDDAVLADLLARTSRTFALAIPCLPSPARLEVTIAYLLLRVADTIEDGTRLNREEKLTALDRFEACLRTESTATTGPLDLPRQPSENAHDLALLDELPLVLRSLRRIRSPVREEIIKCTRATVGGMQAFITDGSSAGNVQIHSVDELRRYCYFVAGIVGELLTEIFVAGATWLQDVHGELHDNAAAFGEALQLVNILKDADDDQQNGRVFVPTHSWRPVLFELARRDLHQAEAYADTLRQAKAPAGFIAFTEIPLRLAWRTLDYVEQFGPGSKVPRAEVVRIVAQATSGESSRRHQGAANR